MVDAASGATYEQWKTIYDSSDELASKGAEHMMVTLYDQNGGPQLVRGSAVMDMLAKETIFATRDEIPDVMAKEAVSPVCDAITKAGDVCGQPTPCRYKAHR